MRTRVSRRRGNLSINLPSRIHGTKVQYSRSFTFLIMSTRDQQSIANLNIMKRRANIFQRRLFAVALMAATCSAQAQQINGTPGLPGATMTLDGKQIPPADPTFGGVIKDTAVDSKPFWPP